MFRNHNVFFMFIVSLEAYLVNTLLMGYINFYPICLALTSKEEDNTLLMSKLDFYRAVLLIGMMFALTFAIPIAYLISIQLGNYMQNKTTYMRFSKYQRNHCEDFKHYEAINLYFSGDSEMGLN